MASVPSAGCLLAKNQYYRSKCWGPGAAPCCSPPTLRPGGPLSPPSLSRGDGGGLPELIDKCWWIKSFFHSEPSQPPVGRKRLSAS
ncbi:PDPFL protein, partial [Halcyon senegalensis]|nr:PDPFL protein [Halcyon senegalensis]